MFTDLRYALRQVQYARTWNGSPNAADAMQRAIDALERCLEASQSVEAMQQALLDAIESQKPVELPIIDGSERPLNCSACGVPIPTGIYCVKCDANIPL